MTFNADLPFLVQGHGNQLLTTVTVSAPEHLSSARQVVMYSTDGGVTNLVPWIHTIMDLE